MTIWVNNKNEQEHKVDWKTTWNILGNNNKWIEGTPKHGLGNDKRQTEDQQKTEWDTKKC